MSNTSSKLKDKIHCNALREHYLTNSQVQTDLTISRISCECLPMLLLLTVANIKQMSSADTAMVDAWLGLGAKRTW